MIDDVAVIPKPKKTGFLGSIFGAGKSYYVIALVLGVIAAGGALSILGQAAATTTFYVLGQDLAARDQITSQMLVPVITSVGGQPRNALDPAYVRDHNVFAKLPMKSGDIVSESNVGPLERINANLPGNFVVSSVQVSPENAVAGKIRKGDYVDVIAQQQGDAAGGKGLVAKVVLHRVLVLDVTVAPQTITQSANGGQAGATIAPGPEAAAVRGGIPALYVVGLAPADAVKLALVRDKAVVLTLSANDNTGSVNVQSQLTSVFSADGVPDSGAGTDAAARAGAKAPATPTTPGNGS